jgi:hypothetical protein
VAARRRIIAISGTTSACDEQQRTVLRRPPDEVAADRATQLDLVAGPELVGQVRGNLAVVEALDRELDARAVGRRRDRVAALRLVAVFGGEADVDMLPGAMSGPAGDVEGDRLDARRLDEDVDDVRDLPDQSPQYRCSCHGSP